MTLTAGARLGPYEILAPLGAGGMGEVYKARDTRLERDVALKVLPTHLAEDRAALARFEREAKAVASLSHPDILAIHDFGKHGNTTYAVMELLEGETLRDRLGRGRLPLRQVIEYGVHIARGLAAAHEKGLIHRDLKPENLFLTRDGRLKILDFGLARARAEAAGADVAGAPTVSGTEPGTVLGTVGYMSPEQVRGQPVDHLSDLFALGCVLYEMATGQRAFHRGSPSDTLAAILRDEPPEPAPGSGMPPPLERIVRHCLEKNQEARSHSAHDVAFALEALAPEATAVAPPRPASLMRRWLPAALAVAVLVGSFALWRQLRSGARPGARPPAPVRSLAVLPLANLSGDPEQQYFADGMTEALITDLAQLSGLKVISRTSIMQYKDSRKPLPQIARELGVEAVVEGSVQRHGDRVRISAQLIQAPSDTHLWARSYEAELRDILALQSKIARAIAGEIRLRLAPEEVRRLVSARRVNPEGHEAYLKGIHHFSRITLEGFEKARTHFERAIALDPDYAPPHAQLGMLFATMAVFGGMSPGDAAPRATSATARALELDDNLAEAHLARAIVLRDLEWDFAGSEREFRRTLELNPNHALARDMYGILLLIVGRYPEAEEQMRRALDLDPLNLDASNNLGFSLLAQRDYDRAIQAYRQTIELDPSFLMAHRELGLVLAHAGRPAEAVAEVEKAAALSRDPFTLAYVGHVYALAGRAAEARQILAGLERDAATQPISPFFLAYVQVALGEREAALRNLEEAFQQRQPQMIWIAMDPGLDPLRRDPRFRDLLRRVGLPSG